MIKRCNRLIMKNLTMNLIILESLIRIHFSEIKFLSSDTELIIIQIGIKSVWIVKNIHL